MNNKGSIISFVVLVFIVVLIAGSIYYIPNIDISKPIIEKEETCQISVSESTISLVEGEDGVLTFDIYSEIAGTFEFTLTGGFPPFASTDGTKIVPAFTNVKHDVVFKNATSIIRDGVYSTSWDRIRLKVVGPTECSISFEVKIIDNCPEIYNPEQIDSDLDGIGDVCDEQTCGNYICEPEENKTNCCSDCGCLPGQECEENECTGVAYVCSFNEDCRDDITCTRNICFHPNTQYAHCGYDEISVCSEDRSDSCCPEDCNANDDIDCDYDCGNGVCEDFFGKERFKNCHQDCEED